MEESEGGPIAEDVRRRILSMLAQGALRPGSRLGTEREMAEQFDVSRSTLRSALLPLSRAGVLERRTGRNGGTFVRADVVERNAAELAGLPARLRSGGHTSATRVLATDRRAATPAEAAALEITTAEEVFAIRRLRFADGVPLSVDFSCFIAEQVVDLLEQPLGGSIYELLAVRYGLSPATDRDDREMIVRRQRQPGKPSGSASRTNARWWRSPASPTIPRTGRSNTPTTCSAPTASGSPRPRPPSPRASAVAPMAGSSVR